MVGGRRCGFPWLSYFKRSRCHQQSTSLFSPSSPHLFLLLRNIFCLEKGMHVYHIFFLLVCCLARPPLSILDLNRHLQMQLQVDRIVFPLWPVCLRTFFKYLRCSSDYYRTSIFFPPIKKETKRKRGMNRLDFNNESYATKNN